MTPSQAALAEWLEWQRNDALKIAETTTLGIVAVSERKHAAIIDTHLATFRALVEENEMLKDALNRAKESP